MTYKEEIIAAIWGSDTPKIGKVLPLVIDRKKQKNSNAIATLSLNVKKFQDSKFS